MRNTFGSYGGAGVAEVAEGAKCGSWKPGMEYQKYSLELIVLS